MKAPQKRASVLDYDSNMWEDMLPYSPPASTYSNNSPESSVAGGRDVARPLRTATHAQDLYSAQSELGNFESAWLSQRRVDEARAQASVWRIT